MAVFAKYDGVDGESGDSSHDKWIDILSTDWGMDRPVNVLPAASVYRSPRT